MPPPPPVVDLIGDDAWCLTHSTKNGLRVASAPLVDLLQAGCLLAEMMSDEWLRIDEGPEPVPVMYLTAIDRRDAEPAETILSRNAGKPVQISLVRGIWNAVVGERYRCPVTKWLRFVAGTADRDLTERMIERGAVKVSRRGGELAPDFNTCTRAQTRLTWKLEKGLVVDPQDVVLIALVHAAQLDSLLELRGGAVAGHAAVLERFKDFAPGFVALAELTDSVARSAIMAGRT